MNLITPATEWTAGEAIFDAATVIQPTGMVSGALLPIEPPARPVAIGVRGNTYYENYYDRIWLWPAVYKLENAQRGSAYAVGVWNAYDVAKTLEAFTGNAAIELLTALPVTFTPLEYRKLQIKIADNAPANLSSSYILDFGDVSATLRISYSLDPLFLAIQDDEPVETWEWRTVINIAADGTEQRAQLRFNPRVQQQFTVTLPDDVDRAAFMSNLWTYTAKPVAMPMLARRAPLTMPVAAGSNIVRFDPRFADVREGEKAAFYNVHRGDRIVLFDVAQLYSDGARLVTPVEEDFGIEWEIVSAPMVRLPDGSSLAMDHRTGKLSLNVEVAAVRAPVVYPGVIPTFDGLPVIPFEMIAVSSVQEEFNQALEVYDVGILPALVRTWRPVPTIQGAREWVADRETEVPFWNDFSATIRGSLKPFLISTGREDFILTQPAEPGATEIFVSDNGFAPMFGPALSRVAIYAGGAPFYRVIGAVEQADAGTLRIVLVAPLPNDAGLSIDRIAMLQKVRLTDDRLTLKHSLNHSIVTLNVQTVNE